MGLFSVACGMSHIPITGGEHVLFLPIKQNRYLTKIPKQHFFCYADDLYEPVLLPIEGFYNSYGTIENIIKNEHTLYLEEKFNNSIEIIMETITHKKDLFSIWDNKLSSAWGLTIFKENVVDTFFNLGFKLIEKECSAYLYLEKYNLYILSSDSSDYTFLISNSYIIKQGLLEKKYTFDRGTSLQEFIFVNFNILLGLKDENNMEPLMNLYNMGGQFFLKSIYDDISNISFSEYKMNKIKEKNSFNFTLSKLHLLDLGFIEKDEKYYYKDLIIVNDVESYISEVTYQNKIHKFFSLNEFLSFFAKKNIGFDRTKLEKYTFFKTKILELKDLLNNNDVKEINNLKEQYILEGKDISALLNKVLKRSSTSIIERHLFGSNSSFLSENYIDYFHKTAINFDLNEEYPILDYYSSFSKFKEAMVATNKLFIPSFCGYQDGAEHVSKYLSKLTLKILNKKD